MADLCTTPDTYMWSVHQAWYLHVWSVHYAWYLHLWSVCHVWWYLPHIWSVHHTWCLHVICVPCLMILTTYLICAPRLILTCDLCAMSDDTYHISDLCTTPDHILIMVVSKYVAHQQFINLQGMVTWLLVQFQLKLNQVFIIF